MNAMDHLFEQLSHLSAPVLAAVVALAGACGAIASAIITVIFGKLVVTPFLGARDKQDREVEWRKHAIELTKLDLDRKLKTRAAGDTSPLRPSILDFLANYRDLQELGDRSPRQLYEIISTARITSRPLQIGDITLPDGTVNTDYPATVLTASGGAPPYKWSVAPALPPGLLLNEDTGTITGKPGAVTAKTPYTVTVTDAATPKATATATASLEIK
jgi:putative Ig domain-containing protein